MKKVFLFIVLAFSLSINAQDSTKAPLLLQEFYTWHIAKNSLGILLGIFTIILGYNSRKLWGKKVDKDYEKRWDEVILNGYASNAVSITFSIIFSSIVGFIFLIKCTYSLVFILVAPKLYLIEYYIK